MRFDVQPLTVPIRFGEHDDARIGGGRMLLEAIVYPFRAGETPEDIVRSFPSLQLNDVYTVIAFYLQNKAEVDAYLQWREESAEAARIAFEREFPQKDVRAVLEARRAERAQAARNGQGVDLPDQTNGDASPLFQAVPLPIQVDEGGAARIGGTRLLLEAVIYAYREGNDAGDIARMYPTVAPADIYAVLPYALRAPQAIEAYLKARAQQAKAWEAEVEARFPSAEMKARLEQGQREAHGE